MHATASSLIITHVSAQLDPIRVIFDAVRRNMCVEQLVLRSPRDIYGGVIIANEFDNESPSFEPVAACLSSHPFITDVDFSDMRIRDVNAIQLSEAFRTTSIIRCINLTRCLITSVGCKPILESLSTCIHTVILTDNPIRLLGARAVAEMLCVNTSLTHLGLRGSCLGDKGLALVTDILKTNCSLKILDISDTEMTATGGRLVADMLQTNTSLTSLDVSDNAIGNCKVLFQMICDSTRCSVTSVAARRVKLSLLCWQLLTASLRDNAKIRGLDLSNNFISDSLESAFVEALVTTTSLTSLSLSHIRLSKVYFAKLAQFVITTTALEELDLSLSLGGREIIDALADNSSVTKIKLQMCSFGSETWARVINLLAMNSTLTSLDLMHNNIDKVTMDQLISVMDTNMSVTELLVSPHRFIDDGSAAARLNERLQKNRDAVAATAFVLK